MESFDEEDDLALPAPEKPLSPLPKPKLKRLKKATSPSLLRTLAKPGVSDDPTPISAVASEPGEIRTGTSCAMEKEGLDEETAQELDPLFAYRSGEGILGDPDVLEVDASEVRGGKGEAEGAMEESVKEHNVKRRLRLEDEGGDSNTRKKKKGKSRKLEGPDEKPNKESVRDRKRLEKARKAELEHLHAESQRLLRETRDASFKPVQLIQKPISSVLEKIRLRKLEILKSSLPSDVDTYCAAGIDGNSDPLKGQSDIKVTEVNACVTIDVGSEGKRQNLINDTQVDKRGSQLSTGGDKVLNSQEASPPSYPTTSSLKIDAAGNDDGASSSDHDISSSEEDSDKENIGPRAYSVVKDLSPKDNIAKAFLDVEAEEEDDSDCDLLRFQENEEESDTDEHEELDDLIATGYEEAPMDQEKRNELHQKWLEQQDAAETENVIQRLKSGRQGLGKPALIHGDHGNHDESDNDDDEGNDSDDEAKYKNHPIDKSRQSLKKAKQMISHMFTDANDVYIPSDDEETEKSIIRQQIKHSEEPSFISPVEDESSREFFSLIKKLNIAPTTKKRGKASAPLFDSAVLSGSSNSSSKSSFLNRATNSLPPSHKQGSISVRAFIFGRDDSNSRNNISTSEINKEKAEMENIPAKNSMKDKLGSSLKSSVIQRTVQTNSESGSSSLFNILRQSAIRFDKKLESKNSVGSHVITESQAAYKFSAFSRRNSKMDSRT